MAAGDCDAASSVHSGLLPILVSQLVTSRGSIARRNGLCANGIRLKLEDREKALAAYRRGACKELGMPITGDRSRLKNRSAGLDLDQNYCGSGNRYGRGRVHHDAERAMIGIGFHRMHVRHLDKSQQRKQNQADQGHCRQSTRLCAAFIPEMRLELRQPTTPVLRIHTIGCTDAGQG